MRGLNKNFLKIKRISNSTINDFISEFEKEYILAKTAGCVYSDTLIAFRLLGLVNLGGVDFGEGFEKGLDFLEGLGWATTNPWSSFLSKNDSNLHGT